MMDGIVIQWVDRTAAGAISFSISTTMNVLELLNLDSSTVAIVLTLLVVIITRILLRKTVLSKPRQLIVSQINVYPVKSCAYESPPPNIYAHILEISNSDILFV
jgi:hypothetical protein